MIDRKAIHDLMDKAQDVHEQTGHYISVSLRDSEFPNITVNVVLGGLRNDCELDFNTCFYFKDGDAEYDATMAYLDGLLKDESQAGGAVRDSSN